MFSSTTTAFRPNLKTKSKTLFKDSSLSFLLKYNASNKKKTDINYLITY